MGSPEARRTARARSSISALIDLVPKAQADAPLRSARFQLRVARDARGDFEIERGACVSHECANADPDAFHGADPVGAVDPDVEAHGAVLYIRQADGPDAEVIERRWIDDVLRCPDGRHGLSHRKEGWSCHRCELELVSER